MSLTYNRSSPSLTSALSEYSLPLKDPVAVVLDAEADREAVGVLDHIEPQFHRWGIGQGGVQQLDRDVRALGQRNLAGKTHLA